MAERTLKSPSSSLESLPVKAYSFHQQDGGPMSTAGMANRQTSSEGHLYRWWECDHHGNGVSLAMAVGQELNLMMVSSCLMKNEKGRGKVILLPSKSVSNSPAELELVLGLVKSRQEWSAVCPACIRAYVTRIFENLQIVKNYCGEFTKWQLLKIHSSHLMMKLENAGDSLQSPLVIVENHQ